MPTFAEVILPLPVKSNFHYRVRETQRDQVAVGKRVLVQFGKNKIYTGVIRQLSEALPDTDISKLKQLEEILDQAPILHELQLALFEWISFYYACTPGEVFKAALPAGLKPESSLRVEMQEGIEWEAYELSDKEYLLLEALQVQPVLNFKEVADLWDMLNPSPRLKAMESRGLIRLYQKVEPRYKPKYKTYLRLNDPYTHEARLREAFDSLSARAVAQENLLMHVVSEYYKGNMVPKSEALKALDIGAGVAKALLEKGFIAEEPVQIDRMELYGYKVHDKEIVFNAEQARAMAQIRSHIQSGDGKPILLHGITGSGKTHLYIDLIKEALEQGKQVLYLLPEITLTKQIIDRVKSELGERVGIYHSRFNDHERVEIYRKVRARTYDVVIGVRSAIFLPFEELGLIVVDEEHDHSFKQHEPAPRYNARDLAIYYGHVSRCPVVLGSATPSFESYQNALKGKYHLVELHKRAVAAHPPVVEVVDMRMQRKQRTLRSIFSSTLYTELEAVLKRKEQAILFQNRRGYSPYLICETCGHVPECINCDISLTYHKEKKHLRCHYCGHTDFNLNACKECGNYTLRRSGIGTEKIEEAVREVFPEARVERMDLDTTRSKMAFQNIITRFENHDIDILVGTQMVSKGLDFENVTLVGVINADNLLTFPDFRAYENAYQLLTQVSGRAGRSTKKGKVLIQSLMPDNVVLTSLNQSFRSFFERELPGRQQLGYPPFSRLIRIEVRHRDKAYIEQEALRLNNLLKPQFGANLLGPDYTLVARVRNQYRMQFLIKLSKGLSPEKVRQALDATLRHYYEVAPQKTLRIILDVDPV